MGDNEQWHRHLGVYGICLSDERLLIIRKGNGPYTGRYDLPGGTIEAHESLTEAVRREFLEEVGVDVKISENVGACDYLIPYKLPKRGTSHIHHVAIFFRSKLSVAFLPKHLKSSKDKIHWGHHGYQLKK